MTQMIIVVVIVAAAVGYGVWRVVGLLRGRGGCSCGCDGCSQGGKKPASSERGCCGKADCHCCSACKAER